MCVGVCTLCNPAFLEPPRGTSRRTSRGSSRGTLRGTERFSSKVFIDIHVFFICLREFWRFYSFKEIKSFNGGLNVLIIGQKVNSESNWQQSQSSRYTHVGENESLLKLRKLIRWWWITLPKYYRQKPKQKRPSILTRTKG